MGLVAGLVAHGVLASAADRDDHAGPRDGSGHAPVSVLEVEGELALLDAEELEGGMAMQGGRPAARGQPGVVADDRAVARVAGDAEGDLVATDGEAVLRRCEGRVGHRSPLSSLM